MAVRAWSREALPLPRWSGWFHSRDQNQWTIVVCAKMHIEKHLPMCRSAHVYHCDFRHTGLVHSSSWTLLSHSELKSSKFMPLRLYQSLIATTFIVLLLQVRPHSRNHFYRQLALQDGRREIRSSGANSCMFAPYILYAEELTIYQAIRCGSPSSVSMIEYVWVTDSFEL